MEPKKRKPAERRNQPEAKQTKPTPTQSFENEDVKDHIEGRFNKMVETLLKEGRYAHVALFAPLNEMMWAHLQYLGSTEQENHPLHGEAKKALDYRPEV